MISYSSNFRTSSKVRMGCALVLFWSLALFSGVSSAALSFQFEYIDDTTGGFSSRGWLDPNSLFQRNIVAATQEWGKWFASDETIIVDVVSSFGVARAGGTHTVGRKVGETPEGQDIWEPGPLTRILTGSNLGETYYGFDIKLYFNPDFVESAYWFDTQPEFRTDPVPANLGDFTSVVMHEFGHGLAMAGYRSFSFSNYGELSPSTITLFDSLTYFGGDGNPLSPEGTPNPMFFAGAAAAEAYGSDVPLTHVPQGHYLASENFYHLSTCQGDGGLQLSLMNGCAIPNGERLLLTDIDLAVMEDIGYPIIIPGDFDYDRDVDGADFLAWQRGESPMPLSTYDLDAWKDSFDTYGSGDFDNDGDVDGADFLAWQRGESPDSLSSSDLAIWQENFGSPASAPMSTAVPEPRGMVLCFVALAIGILASPATFFPQRRRGL